MITRAQAEALLTLAESLEACERLGVKVSPDENFIMLDTGDRFEYVGSMSSIEVRLAVNALIPGGQFTTSLLQKRFPKQET